MSCQQAQHVKLYYDLLQAYKGEIFDGPGPQPGGTLIYVSMVPHNGSEFDCLGK